jgi:hypothetical protein
VLNTGDQNAGRLAGGGEFASGGGFGEEVVRAVALGIGVGKHGDESWPGGVGENAVGVLRDRCAYVGDERARLRLAGLADGEVGQRRDEGGVSRCAEVQDGLARGGGLLGVAPGLVPAGGEHAGPDDGGGQGGEGAVVGTGSGVDYVAGCGAQSASGVFLRPNLGALRAGEGAACRPEIGT